jgi:hypothetical protein
MHLAGKRYTYIALRIYHVQYWNVLLAGIIIFEFCTWYNLNNFVIFVSVLLERVTII